MAYTAAQITALETAIASGTTRVSYGDKSVEYRSLSEMKELLAMMRRDFLGAGQRRQFRVVTPGDKGL